MYRVRTEKKRVTAALAAAVLALSAVLASPTAAEAQMTTGRAYVGMGDSFPANPDIPLQLQGLLSGECVKRTDAYPDRIGHEAFGGDYVNLACNGSTLSGGAGPSLVSQMNAAHARGEIGTGTQLVTITVGAAEGWNPATPDRRDFGFWDGGDYVTGQSWSERIGPVVNRIHELAPGARVMVVGYPEVGNDHGAICLMNLSGGPGGGSTGSSGNLPLAVPTAFEGYIEKLNHMAATHQYLGYEYVHTAQPGTGTCAHPDHQWVRAIIDVPGAGDGMRMPVHPTALGDQQVAEIVKARI